MGDISKGVANTLKPAIYWDVHVQSKPGALQTWVGLTLIGKLQKVDKTIMTDQ
jgi:hypothetical protein